MQGYENFLQLLLDWFVNQITIAIKLCRRFTCVQEELRFVDEMKIEKNSNLAKVILWPFPTRTSWSTYNCSCFVSANIWWSRCPVNCILQWSWYSGGKKRVGKTQSRNNKQLVLWQCIILISWKKKTFNIYRLRTSTPSHSRFLFDNWII